VVQLTCNPFFNPTVDATYTDNRNDAEVTGTFNISYNFTAGWIGYASYSRGYKAGGYNLDRAGLANPLLGGTPMATDLEFKPETVDSYEAGAKGVIGDRVTTNIAVFYADFNDFQLNRFTGTAFVVENLEQAISKGVELEVQAAATDNLTLGGGLVYQDARYGDNVSNTALAGKRLTNAPLWTATASARYDWDWSGDLRSWFSFDYRFNSDMNTGSDLDPQKAQASYALFGGRLGIGDPDDNWTFDVWGKNLFGRDYVQVAFDAPLQPGGINAFLGDPRTYGATLRLNF
jgi:iron complex outermembrane receptor protein